MDYVQTNQQRELVQSIMATPAIATMNENDAKNSILELISYWRVMIGVPNKDVGDVAQELASLVQFIFNNYKHMTCGELKLAIDYSIMGVLKDVEFNGFFSPMYVSKVLQSYLTYRKIQLTDPIDRMEKDRIKLEEDKKKPSPEERCKNTKLIMKEFYEEWKATGEINDPFGIAYEFLRKVKWLKVSQKDLDDSLAYGRTKANNWKNKSDEKGMRFDADMPTFQRRFAKAYLVQKFFSNVNIDVLLNNIKPELFT